MNTIGTRVTSGVIGSVKGSWEPGQTNERKKKDDETVITTCSAKTVKWINVSKSSMAAHLSNGTNLYSSIEAFVRDEGGSLPILLRLSVNHASLVELARSKIRPRIVENLSDEELIQRISAAVLVRDASRASQVVTEEIPIVARAGSGEDSGISSASNVSQSSMAARRSNGQNLYSSIEAFVRDQASPLARLLRVSVNDVVELARFEIRPRIVENLSDEELIQRISAAVRVRDASGASQVVPEEIPIVARAGSGEDSGISSVTMHQAEGNYAVELESGSVGTYSTVTGARSAAEDDVIAAQQLLVAETVSTSSSERQNPQANSSRRESHALLQQQPPQNEDQTDETDDERKEEATR